MRNYYDDEVNVNFNNDKVNVKCFKNQTAIFICVNESCSLKSPFICNQISC